MTEKESAFITEYKRLRELTSGARTQKHTVDITDLKTKGKNIRTLAAVCLMLVDSSLSKKLRKGLAGIDINNIHKLTMDELSAMITKKMHPFFAPYIDMIMSGTKTSNTKEARIANYNAYITMIIRYMFIVKIEHIRAISE